MNIISGFSAQNNHVRFKTCWQFGEAHGDRCRGAWSPDFGLRCTANPTMMSRGFPRFHMTAQGGKHKWAWRSIQPHKSQANLTGGTPGVKLPKILFLSQRLTKQRKKTSALPALPPMRPPNQKRDDRQEGSSTRKYTGSCAPAPLEKQPQYVD